METADVRDLPSASLDALRYPMGPSPAEAASSPPALFADDGFVASLHRFFTSMAPPLNVSCLYNCSGRGECLEGTCFCQVQYEGASCGDPNVAYFASFSLIFSAIAAVCLAQLIVCVRSEYARMKTPSLRAACAITTQKALYASTFVASVLRAAYFSSPSHADLPLSASFMSAFYPIILTAGSLIVCFWAEAFHLRDIRCERPRFLGKSICGFLTFNAITYSLFLAEVILTKKTNTHEQRSFLGHVFNGCYAVLLFIVVVFFLIYGVEVYFKVRGGFVSDTVIVGNVQSRPAASLTTPTTTTTASDASPLLDDDMPPSPHKEEAAAAALPRVSKEKDEKEKNEATQTLIVDDENKEKAMLARASGALMAERSVDHSQLHQSRFGLVFQACMLMITVCFLCSDVLGGFWKNKVALMSRNAYDILFRVVELAVALWFPCVLWNCIAPEQLWILNPKKILKKLDFEKTLELGEPTHNCGDLVGECWICYDAETADCGPLITPCDCKGDVAAVHHNCLRKWLIECAPTNIEEKLSCKVCGAEYQLERTGVWWPGGGFTTRQWLQTASLVTAMCAAVAAFWAAMELCEDANHRAIAAGATLIVLYVCLRLLGFNVFTGYQRAKISAAKILGGRFSSSSSSSSTTSISTVTTVATVRGIAELHLAQEDLQMAAGVSAFPMPQSEL